MKTLERRIHKDVFVKLTVNTNGAVKLYKMIMEEKSEKDFALERVIRDEAYKL